MKASSVKTNSPRSVHHFVRFDVDEEDRPTNTKKHSTCDSAGSSQTSHTSSPSQRYSDQLPLGSSFQEHGGSKIKRNFVIRNSATRSHSAPSGPRYMDQLPLGSSPQYTGVRTKTIRLRDFSPQQSPITPSSLKFSDQLPLTGSPSQEDWNMVRQKPNLVPSASSLASCGNRSVLPPPPPLVQAPSPARVTKLIRNFENATTRMSRQSCAIIIQLAYRRFLARKRLEERRVEFQRLVPRIYAAVKIQSTVRTWFCCMKYRVSMLKKDLERSQRRKAYSLQWVQEKKQEEMERFEKTERLATDRKIRRVERNLTRTRQEIQNLRSGNKKFRSQNKTLAEAKFILGKKISKEREGHEAKLQEIASLEAEIAKLKREEKRLAVSESVYPKFVHRFSDTLAQVNEHAEVERKSKTACKDTIANIMNLVKETCTDEELVQEIVEMGTTFLLKDSRNSKESEHGAPNELEQIVKKWQSDVSETETSETEFSASDEENADLILSKIMTHELDVSSSETEGHEDVFHSSDNDENVS